MVHADRADTDDRRVRMTGRAATCYYESVAAVRPRIERRVQVVSMARQVFAP